MQSYILTLAFTALLATCVLGGDEVKCACEVTIDCANVDRLTTAATQLTSDNCANDCTSAACRTNFFLVQAHHDYCAAALPDSVSDALHDNEDKCDYCHIERQFDSALSACPAYECSSSSEATTAAAALTSEDCNTDCTTGPCVAAYRTVRAAHDRCDEDDVPEAVEDSLHEFEESCEAAECNVATKDAGVPTCSAAQVGAGVTALVMAVVASLFV